MNSTYQFLNRIIVRAPLGFIGGENNIDFLDNPTHAEALYLASPVLYHSQSKRELTFKESEKLKNSLNKYRIRICNRCTPYGLFAAVGVSQWEHGESNIVLSGKFIRKTRLDMNVLCGLYNHILSIKTYRNKLKFYPNNSLYRIANTIRYVDYSIINNYRLYSIASISMNEIISEILKECEQGKSIEDLTCILVAKGIDLYTATKFINELVDEKIIVSELEPNTTGDDYLSFITETIKLIDKKEATENKSISKELEEINNRLSYLDQSFNNEINSYEIIKNYLTKLSFNFNQKDVFQCDASFIENQGGVSNELKNSLSQVTISLLRLFKDRTNNNLENFKKKFKEKFENQGIPILKLLDSDIGIGYPPKPVIGNNPLLEGITLGKNIKNETLLNQTESFLLQKLILALQEGSDVIHLTSTEIERHFNLNNANIPDFVSILFSILSTKQNITLFKSANGNPSSIIGRFGIVSSEIKNVLEEISELEADIHKNCILAEIVHLPQERTGNILFRPSTRLHEIPYLGRSSVNFSNQISLSNLIVYVKDDRVILWDKKLKTEIIPRLSNSHNYLTNSLPVYHFLCDLQNQNKINNIYFDWGNLYLFFKRFPRITIDTVIVSPATWIIPIKELIQEGDKEYFKLKNEVCHFQTKYELPDKILYSEFDNELLIDLKNQQSLNVLSEISKRTKKEALTLKECLVDIENPLIKDMNGNKYLNECVAFACLNNTNERVSHSLFNPGISALVPDEIRKFSLGDEWLYFKLYTGSKLADTIIVELISPLIISLVNSKLIDKWFFIRYADPESHIRLRLHLNNKSNLSKIIEMLNVGINPFIKHNIIFKVALDTYVRELERYGVSNIENTEDLFCFDSDLNIKLISASFKNDTTRWQFALLNIDNILNDFGLNLEGKHEVLSIIIKNIKNELNLNDKISKSQIDYKFRELRTQINEIIGDANYNKQVSDYFLERTKKSKNLINKIKKSLTTEGIHLVSYITDYMHMSLNRLFSTRINENEIVAYYLMYRYYESSIARTKKNKKTI